MPRVMPGHGFVHTSSPTSPGGSGFPSGPYTSIAMPSAGPPSVHGRSGVNGVGDRKHAPTSVPPEILMIGQRPSPRSEEHTSELQSPDHLVCRLLLEKKKHQKRYKQ